MVMCTLYSLIVGNVLIALHSFFGSVGLDFMQEAIALFDYIVRGILMCPLIF